MQNMPSRPSSSPPRPTDSGRPRQRIHRHRLKVLPLVEGPGVSEDSPAAPAAPAAPVAVPPTFAEALQAAISQFSTSVGALKSLDSDVDQAVDEKAAAQVALVAAQGSEKTKITNRDTGRVAAIDDRDVLVGVLQSWAP